MTTPTVKKVTVVPDAPAPDACERCGETLFLPSFSGEAWYCANCRLFVRVAAVDVAATALVVLEVANAIGGDLGLLAALPLVLPVAASLRPTRS